MILGLGVVATKKARRTPDPHDMTSRVFMHVKCFYLSFLALSFCLVSKYF